MERHINFREAEGKESDGEYAYTKEYLLLPACKKFIYSPMWLRIKLVYF